MIEQEYFYNLMDVAHAIRECGAKELWRDLKKYYPDDYNTLLFAAQDVTEQEINRLKFPLGMPDFRDSINSGD